MNKVKIKEENQILKDLKEIKKKGFPELCECSMKKYLKTLDRENVCCEKEYQQNYIMFYGMNRTAKKFKDEYFKLLKENDNLSSMQYVERFKFIATKLKRKDKNYQFSFITKLMHTLNRDLPIYDRMIREAVGLEDVYGIEKYEDKVEKSIEIMQAVIKLYENLLKKDDIKKIFDTFDNKFPIAKSISDTKKLDFMLWALGKNI